MSEATGTSTFLSHRQIMIVLPGLLMAMLLAMLDQLVVGTALPRIVGDLGGATHLSWVVTAYVLASTITTPFYGKLGDMYGRKKLFIFAIVVFLIGSALSGLSASMGQLITFRALQGLGAGGLMVGAMATLGEIVPPRERGKYMSYFMVVMMLATVGGPLVGGWITTAFSWRWIFYINLPLGGAALVYLIAVMKLPARRVEHRIDYAGGILLGVVATAIILLATWGGTEYQWGSWEIIGLLLIAIAALVAFLAVEQRQRVRVQAAEGHPVPAGARPQRRQHRPAAAAAVHLGMDEQVAQHAHRVGAAAERPGGAEAGDRASSDPDDHAAMGE